MLNFKEVITVRLSNIHDTLIEHGAIHEGDPSLMECIYGEEAPIGQNFLKFWLNWDAMELEKELDNVEQREGPRFRRAAEIYLAMLRLLQEHLPNVPYILIDLRW